MRRAFTLIEMLIVIAMIAVLAAIAVPNFLEAQTRGKISKAKSDMSVVMLALRSYSADHNQFPPHQPEIHAFLTVCAAVTTVTAENTSAPADARYVWVRPEAQLASAYPILEYSGNDLWQLTTPIAYCGRILPEDPFKVETRLRGSGYDVPGFSYVNLSAFSSTKSTASNRKMLILSPGSDRDADAFKTSNPLHGPWETYDATNGTISNGDILLSGITRIADHLQPSHLCRAMC